ncbi:sperm flagellar protein 1-like isoform X2 [Hyaena hyaena]|uniref:sperm flagellar protein 1-like isoform X2 n=1 Tax=Hyaena hyaena TaxID=95912 RepID=UPI00192183A3|nr:sperm flagellar protein 1-like isoform X2 [Hyaena hyaena]
MLGAAGPAPRASPQPLPPGALRGLCAWLDGLPLSRPKRHLARDFSDGVMLAEIVKHFCPRLVDLHNYVPTCNTDQKLSNWSILNRKVFHKLRLWVSETDIRKVVANTPGAIEPILCALREKVTDCAAHQDPPAMAGPGPFGGTAERPRAELTAPPHTVRTRRGDPGGTWTPGCSSCWRKRSRHWLSCRRWSSSLHVLLAGEQTARLAPPTMWSPSPSPWTACCLSGFCAFLKILQMKVVRLEHLVKLKDQRIGELTRPGNEPQ